MPTPSTDQTIVSWWRKLSLAYGGLLVWLGVYYAQGHGRSARFQLLAAGVVGLAAGVSALALWLTAERQRTLARRARPWRFPLLCAAFLLLFALGMGSRPEWFYAFLTALFAATLLLLYRTLFAATPLQVRHPRLWTAAAATALLGFLALRAYALGIYPPLHAIDEPWTLGWALSYARTGHLEDWLMFDRPFAIYRFYWAMGTWLRVVGEGFWQARLFTFLLIPLVALLSAKAAANLYGRETALFTALALLFSVVLAHGARVRHDIGLGLSVAASLWLHSEALKQGRAVFHFLGGAAIALGYWSHYHATIFGVALLVGLYGPRYVARWRAGQRTPQRGALLYGAGGLLTALLVFLVQPMPLWVARTANPAQLAEKSAVLATVYRHLLDAARLSQYEFVLLALGVAAALKRRQPPDRAVVAALGCAHLALGVASLHQGTYYIIPLTPLYGILIGSLFSHGFRRAPIPAPTKHVRTGALIACLLFLMPNAGAMLRSPLSAILHREPVRQLPPPPAAQWVAEHVPVGKTVVGEHRYYLWLTDYRFVSPLAANVLVQQHPTTYPTEEAAWDAINADVLIVDADGTAYPIFARLEESGYLQSRRYVVAAQWETVTIYTRAPADAPP